MRPGPRFRRDKASLSGRLHRFAKGVLTHQPQDRGPGRIMAWGMAMASSPFITRPPNEAPGECLSRAFPSWLPVARRVSAMRPPRPSRHHLAAPRPSRASPPSSPAVPFSGAAPRPKHRHGSSLGDSSTERKTERKEEEISYEEKTLYMSPKCPHFDPKMSPNYFIAPIPLSISVSSR